MSKKEKWEVIAHEYVVSLFPIFMGLDALSLGLKRKKIINYRVDLADKFENDSVVYYCRPTNFGKANQLLVTLVQKQPKFLRKIFSAIKQEGLKQVNYTKTIAWQNLSQLSNRLLNNYYQKYYQLNTNLYTYGMVLPLLDFHKTTFLSDEVNKFLKNKNATSYFSILTAPLQDTYNKKQELSLLKILSQIQKRQKLFYLFQKLDSQQLVAILPKKDKNIWQRIKNHTKKYAWVHYVYEGPAGDEAYFIEIIKDFIRRRVNPRKVLVDHKKEKMELRNKQQRILAKLKPGKYYKQIILLARDTVYFKAYRRDLQTISYYYITSLLEEIARRLNLTLKQVRMMLPEEIAAGLLKNQVNVNEINQRLKLVIYYRKGRGRHILTNEAAENFLKNVKTEKIPSGIKEIKGTTAQGGKTRGIAKLINSPEEMGKMNPGNILVSASTNPNLMPAIRKAAAIVTDEGGLTCHAAIVSREFKIPCVIGTKIATRVLKDGDKVEVDANKGIIRRL